MGLQSEDHKPDVERRQSKCEKGVRARLARLRRLLRLAQSAAIGEVREDQTRQRDQREGEEVVEVEEEVEKVERGRRSAVQVCAFGGEEVVGDDVQSGEGGAAVRP